MNNAHGDFEVKLVPQSAADALIGRMSIDKQFHGDLEATSKGEMLAFMTSIKGSAGYVAMEQVTGALNGRSGTFVLQYSGTMARGDQQQSVTVVPDSGTDGLKGLAGKMTIIIANGKHSYDFDYDLRSL
jgi:Ni,Fe-hydrogenase I small subunit